jgi:hypothetical protein
MNERLRRSRDDSDATYFYDILLANEQLLKLTVAGLCASLRRDPDGHQYRIESLLVRADGLGEWSRSLDELILGPTSEHLPIEAREAQRQLTETVVGPDWRGEVLRLIDTAARHVDPNYPGFRKAQLRQWATTFAWLRNKTRAHGAPDLDLCANLAGPLAEATDLLSRNVLVLNWPWAVIRRGISGKYRVTPIGSASGAFGELTKRSDLALDDGVYVAVDGPAHVRLASSDVDLSDFFLANGAFTDTTYEALSYVTGETKRVDSSPFLRAPTPLPSSETHGTDQIYVLNNVLTNMPNPRPDYVSRPGLEVEVRDLLLEDRRPIVTLGGRGGIGKTSLALEVLQGLSKVDRFSNIWWFSSRDIDLLASGPKQVRPDVVNRADIAREFVGLVQAESGPPKLSPDNATALLLAWLSGETSAGPSLFVFDNFETVHAPGDLYRWIDDCVRPPNKVLITTRVRDFRGDYPVEVGGMEEEEFRELVRTVSVQLGIEAIVTSELTRRLYDDSDGHPYVVKILLGEVARTGRPASVERIMAAREDILTALFERTFAHSLTPGAQRIFLTLSAWRSVVPELALKAALLRPANERIDVPGAVDELIRSSLVEATDDPEGERFLSVPLAAQLFGRSKLRVAAARAAIESDLETIQAFGAAQETDVRRGLRPRIDALMSAFDVRDPEERNVLEYVASRYPPAWLRLADAYAEQRDHNSELEAAERYVEARPEDAQGWRRVARLATERGDADRAMNALLQLSELPNTPYREISNAADTFNYFRSKKALGDDWGEKTVMAERLRGLLEARLSEADATDFARLGWICLHLGDVISAKEYARRGLAIDPHNPHCARILAK